MKSKNPQNPTRRNPPRRIPDLDLTVSAHRSDEWNCARRAESRGRSRALKSGAVEFLTKPFRDQDLLDAIQQALQRDRAARDQQAEINTAHERYEALTARERELMTLVVSGMLNKHANARPSDANRQAKPAIAKLAPWSTASIWK